MLITPSPSPLSLSGARVQRLSHGAATDADLAAAEQLIDFMIAGFAALLI